MTTATRMQLGQVVQFRDHQGLIKPAMVTATRDSIDPGKAEPEVPPLRARGRASPDGVQPLGCDLPAAQHQVRVRTRPVVAHLSRPSGPLPGESGRDGKAPRCRIIHRSVR
jgi:hypothetical protein